MVFYVGIFKLFIFKFFLELYSVDIVGYVRVLVYFRWVNLAISLSYTLLYVCWLSYVLFKGDFLETTCIYNTEDKLNATIGGHAITDEMCVNYIHYYPATELEVCKSAVSNEALEKYFDFEKR